MFIDSFEFLPPVGEAIETAVPKIYERGEKVDVSFEIITCPNCGEEKCYKIKTKLFGLIPGIMEYCPACGYLKFYAAPEVRERMVNLLESVPAPVVLPSTEMLFPSMERVERISVTAEEIITIDVPGFGRITGDLIQCPREICSSNKPPKKKTCIKAKALLLGFIPVTVEYCPACGRLKVYAFSG